MPKKRATYTVNRERPPRQRHSIGSGKDIEERRKQLEVFINDFDIEGMSIVCHGWTFRTSQTHLVC